MIVAEIPVRTLLQTKASGREHGRLPKKVHRGWQRTSVYPDVSPTGLPAFFETDEHQQAYFGSAWLRSFAATHA